MDIIIDLAILIGLLVLGVPVPFCFMAAVLFLFTLGNYDPMFIMATGFHKINSMAVLCVLFYPNGRTYEFYWSRSSISKYFRFHFR